ncbi:MAG TPA: hypothetical protein VF894_13705 [Anaeromyxobacter sp.]
MSVMDRIRRLSRAQHEALVAIDRDEQNAVELENLEADHLAAEEAYLRRKDRLLGHEVPDVYQEIAASRALLAQVIRRRQERFEALRVAVLTGRVAESDGPMQLVLLPT